MGVIISEVYRAPSPFTCFGVMIEPIISEVYRVSLCEATSINWRVFFDFSFNEQSKSGSPYLPCPYYRLAESKVNPFLTFIFLAIESRQKKVLIRWVFYDFFAQNISYFYCF